ncbi:hypothetical protein HO924_10685 [Streptococcus suis]|nr:hypothetical protein [Streptococcus suis]
MGRFSAIVEKRISAITIAASSGDLMEARDIFDTLVSKGSISKEELVKELTKKQVSLDFLKEQDVMEEFPIQMDSDSVQNTPITRLVRMTPKNNTDLGFQPISATVENWATFEALAETLGYGKREKQSFLKQVLDMMLSDLSESEKLTFQSIYEAKIMHKRNLKRK